MCWLRTRPRTDVNPPSAGGGGISSHRPRGDNLLLIQLGLPTANIAYGLQTVLPTK